MSKTPETPSSANKYRVLLAIAVCTNLVTLGYIGWYSTRAHTYETKYSYIDVARNFVPQEHFIVNIQPLRERLHALVASEPDLGVSLYFEFLNTGANVSINNELRVWPASLPKVPMAMIVMRKIEQGDWTLDTEMVLTEEDRQDREYGDLWQKPAGTRFTVEELLVAMLTKSDNTPYRIFLRETTQAELLGIVEELGLQDMFGAEGKLSAKEYSRIFRALYTSSFIKRENSQKILSWLTQSVHKNYLAYPMPPTVPFAHKFGVQIEKHAHLDSGIAYIPHRPYLLTVAIQGTGAEGERERIERLMHKISTETYLYISTKE